MQEYVNGNYASLLNKFGESVGHQMSEKNAQAWETYMNLNESMYNYFNLAR